MPELREVIRNTYERLFPEEEAALETSEPDQPPEADGDSESDTDTEHDENPPRKKQNYGEQVSKIFDEALKNSGTIAKVNKLQL